VKAALLDQRRLAGVGNIQAIEALWDAGVHPASPADALDPAAWQRLATAIPRTLHRTLALAGDGEMVYLSQDASQNPFRVYGKAAAPCPRCAAAIVREKLLGRSTFLCPTCQPLAAGGARRPSR
jgi:formamidopyrimidine-DNA glycosylase